MPKILVIDDSAFFRKVVRGFLEGAGYEVEDFHPMSALEVLEKAMACKPDLVITDFNMPNVDGQMVIRMIRRYGAELPVVLLTASWDPEREKRLLANAPLWVLHKPITGDEIIEALKPILPLQQ